MVITNNEKNKKSEPQEGIPPFYTDESNPPFTLTKNAATTPPPEHHHMLLHSHFIVHNPKSGLNPLVDAAAYLFSSIGKIKQLKACRNLNNLQQELIAEINTFQESAKAQGYSSEYILVSRYAICATIDDIAAHTHWGSQDRWETYSLIKIFNQETPQHDRFFLILERIVKDPALYIDVMELMYICLSLGYQGHYRITDTENHLEKITHALYKRIRAYRGDFSKILSPFPIKAPPVEKKTCSQSILLVYLFYNSDCDNAYFYRSRLFIRCHIKSSL